VRFRGEASRVLLILRKCQKQLPRYLPRDIVPRKASSRAQLSAVIAIDFDMTVRPLPDPALRPAPLRWPPWVVGLLIVEVMLHRSLLFR